MKLYSTNDPSNQVSFKEAVFNSMPQDKGLYMPVTIPRLDDKFLNHLDEYSLPEIAFHVAQNLLGDDIPADDLKAIIYDAINFYAPVVRLEDNVYVWRTVYESRNELFFAGRRKATGCFSGNIR
jgi:threonine synthase